MTETQGLKLWLKDIGVLHLGTYNVGSSPDSNQTCLFQAYWRRVFFCQTFSESTQTHILQQDYQSLAVDLLSVDFLRWLYSKHKFVCCTPIVALCSIILTGMNLKK